MVLLVVRSALPDGARWWLWTAAAGLAMGLFGLWYVPFLKRRRARTAARHAVISRGDDPPYPPEAGPMKGKDIGPAVISRGDDPPYPPEAGPMKGKDIGPAGPESGYSSRDSGSNTVSSTDTPGSSTRS